VLLDQKHFLIKKKLFENKRIVKQEILARFIKY